MGQQAGHSLTDAQADVVGLLELKKCFGEEPCHKCDDKGLVRNALSIKYYERVKRSRLKKTYGEHKLKTRPTKYTYTLVKEREGRRLARTPRVLGALLKKIEASY